MHHVRLIFFYDKNLLLSRPKSLQIYTYKIIILLPMSKQPTTEQRAQIYILFEQNLSTREIAEKFGINQSSVVRIINKKLNHNTFDHLGNNGRHSKATSSILALIEKLNNENNRLSLRKMASKVEMLSGKKISYRSIKTYLNFLNIKAFSPIKKPLLSKKNIKKRYDCSKIWMQMSEEKVKKIIFSDESKFNLFSSDGKRSVWRKPSTGLECKNIQPTFKHGGGSVMVWGCFSYNGIGNLHFIDGIMDAKEYACILHENLSASATKMGLNEFIFQQDNDPKHTSRVAKEYFEENEIELLDWPAQSPDMNPIETLWSIIKEKLVDFIPKNKDDLKEKILEIWSGISEETTKKLALSFKKRAKMLFKAEGKHIRY